MWFWCTHLYIIWLKIEGAKAKRVASQQAIRKRLPYQEWKKRQGFGMAQPQICCSYNISEMANKLLKVSLQVKLEAYKLINEPTISWNRRLPARSTSCYTWGIWAKSTAQRVTTSGKTVWQGFMYKWGAGAKVLTCIEAIAVIHHFLPLHVLLPYLWLRIYSCSHPPCR